jgi:hypothetical protein
MHARYYVRACVRESVDACVHPRAFVRACNGAWRAPIDEQGGPHDHTIAAIATTLLDAATPEFKSYIQQARPCLGPYPVSGTRQPAQPPPACSERRTRGVRRLRRASNATQHYSATQPKKSSATQQFSVQRIATIQCSARQRNPTQQKSARRNTTIQCNATNQAQRNSPARDGSIDRRRRQPAA